VTGALNQVFGGIQRDARDPMWVGYTMPLRPGYRLCCGNWRCRDCTCELENGNANFNSVNDENDLHVLRDLLIMVRIENNQLDQIRTFSEDCRLDANDVPVTWLTDVTPAASIAWLTDVATEKDGSHSEDDVIEPAISAIAMHHSPGVIRALERFVDLDNDSDVREHTVFWIGAVGECEGVDVLKRVLSSDPEEDVREQCVFALTLPDCPEAMDALIHVARDDRDADMRGNALFWLANKAGQKAKEAITDAIENDPDTDVKEQAVFALSQLPEEEGVPLLIRLASTNRNPNVREKAIFWLGQSDDPRVVDFFEEILTK
jgi:hypothetical protein